MCEVLDRVENRGIEKGMEKGMELMGYLFKNNRLEDARRATEDASYRSALLKEILGENQY